MMTRLETPSPGEQQALELIREACSVWDENRDYVFSTTIPRRVAIGNVAGGDIAYMVEDVANLFDPLFKEICHRIWHRDCA
jgi:hypothetical protein